MARDHLQGILILGQKKAGTTTLYNLIAPLVPNRLPVPKESSVFDLPCWLFRLLPGLPFLREKIILDATTTYYRNGKFSGRFLTNLGRVQNRRILVIVRDERDRVISHFRHSSALDGFKGDLSAFLDSSEYLDHACLERKLSALAEIGVMTVDVLPFDALNDPVRISAMLRHMLGNNVKGLPDKVQTDNRFGGRRAIPTVLERTVASPIFQTILRPLIPRKLRSAIVRMTSKPISTEGLPQQRGWDDLAEADRAKIHAINARNRSVLEIRSTRIW